MEINRKYRIKVEFYMTKKATPRFDFMKKNGNVPMPFRVMSGEVLEIRGGLYLMRLEEKGKEWTGWVIKSAILKAVDITEPISDEVTVEIKNKKTVVDLGQGPSEKKERALFLLQRFQSVDTDGSKVYFSAYDFVDICKELQELQIPVLRRSGTFFSSLLSDKPNSYSGMFSDGIQIPDIEGLSKIELLPHQVEGVRFGLHNKNFLLGDDMGLGKTLQAILIACGRKQMYGFKHCLIICGVNSTTYNWRLEIEKVSYESAFVLADGGAAKLKQLEKVGTPKVSEILISGMGRKDARIARESNAMNEAYFWIVNIESFRNQEFVRKLQDLCRTGVIGGILFDEIHECVNSESKQAQGALAVSADFQIGLTGTPLVNEPMDSYFTFTWLKKTKFSLWGWKNIYQRKIDQYMTEDRNLWLLQENFSRIMLRRKKEDVLDLPEKVYENIYVDMNREQIQLYAEIQGLPVTECQPAVKFLRKRQAMGSIGLAQEKIHGCRTSNVLSPKMLKLLSLVEEIKAQKRKVVIYSVWTEILDEIEACLGPGVLRIDGSVPKERRVEIQELFQSEAEGGDIQYPILIGTTESCGTGLNFQSASNVIFFDEPFTNTEKEQAVDRCYRIGTKNFVTVVTLMTRGSVDEDVHDIVLGKKQMADVLVDCESERTERMSCS